MLRCLFACTIASALMSAGSQAMALHGLCSKAQVCLGLHSSTELTQTKPEVAADCCSDSGGGSEVCRRMDGFRIRLQPGSKSKALPAAGMPIDA